MDARPATSRRPDVFATSPPSSPDILIAMADFSKVAHEVTSVVIEQNKPIPCIAAFPILADPVDVKKSDQLCETVSQPSIRPDKVDPPMGS